MGGGRGGRERDGAGEEEERERCRWEVDREREAKVDVEEGVKQMHIIYIYAPSHVLTTTITAKTLS